MSGFFNDAEDDEYEHPLILNDGSQLQYFQVTIDEILNKSIAIYGQSKTGKTATIKDILFLLREYVPTVWLICPTEHLNEEYKNIIPSTAILQDITKKFMEDLWERQYNISQLYKRINNIDSFERIYLRIAHSRVTKYLSKLEKLKNRQIEAILETVKNEGMQNIKIKKIEEKITNVKMDVLRSHIIKNRDNLLEMNLNLEEQELVENIELCPRTLIIFDDATAQLAEMKRLKLFDKFATMGRWANITWIIVAHDDKTAVPKEIRKAIFLSIFSSPQLVQSFFEKSAGNGPTKYDMSIANMAAHKIWEHGSREPEKFRKLVWIRDSHEIKYYLPTIRPDFKFGSKAFIQMCEQVENAKKQKNNNVSLYVSKIARID